MDPLDFINLDPNFDDEFQKSKFSLVRKILSPKPLNKKGVSNIISKVWHTAEEVSITTWENNIYAFGSIISCLMILHKWEANKTLEELNFNFSLFWVKIQRAYIGLPKYRERYGYC